MKTTIAPCQGGRTLIELLVAMALGLLILLGVGTLYLASNQSTRASSEGASIENLGQVALTQIGNSLRRGGYSEIVGTEVAGLGINVLYAGPSLRACPNARFVGDDPNAGCGGAVAGAPDAIAIWYQADNQLAAAQGGSDDCVGLPPTAVPVTNANYVPRVPTIPLVSNTFFVVGADLRCRASDTQPLVTGVEDLKVYFGFDDVGFTNPGAIGTVPAARSVRDAAFMNANAAQGSWDQVVSVTVCVLMRSAEQGVTAQGGAATYIPCPQTADEAAGLAAVTPVPSADGRIRRAFTQTFSVRLRTKPSPLAG